MTWFSRLLHIKGALKRLDQPAFWVLTCIFGVLVFVIVAVVSWDWLSSPGESGSTTVRNISLILAGFLALVLAVWRSRVADRQATTAQQGLFNERYQKGAEMLGNQLLSVRLGGIYALRKLAEEHPEGYHVQVMDLFCAFLRNPPTTVQQTVSLNGPNQDVEAILEVIRTRSADRLTIEERVSYVLDLRCSRLQGARLDNANLFKAKLWYADLSSPMDDPINTTRLDDAYLVRANLIRAKLVGVHQNGAKL